MDPRRVALKRRGAKSFWSGYWAEKKAAVFLWIKGYRNLRSRFKTPVGEIDLIARKGKTLCFVEVKKRGTIEEALYALTPQQKQRFRRAASLYLQGNPFEGETRFDIILLWGRVSLKHIQNIDLL